MKVLAAIVATSLLAASADGAATRQRSDDTVHHSSGRPGDRAAAAAEDAVEDYDPFLGMRKLDGHSLSMSVPPVAEDTPSGAPPTEMEQVESAMDPSKAPYCGADMDMECYKEGWPRCCYTADQPCPPVSEVTPVPRCDTGSLILGGNYCTFAPDYECYVQNDGWPECCARFLGSNCGEEQPPCDSGVEVKESGSAARGLSALGAAALISLLGGML